MDNTNEILSIKAASQATGGLLSERRIWLLIKEREIGCVKLGRDVGIRVSELMRYLNRDDEFLDRMAA